MTVEREREGERNLHLSTPLVGDCKAHNDWHAITYFFLFANSKFGEKVRERHPRRPENRFPF